MYIFILIYFRHNPGLFIFEYFKLFHLFQICLISKHLGLLIQKNFIYLRIISYFYLFICDLHSFLFYYLMI